MSRDELTNETLSGTGISAEAVTYAYDNAGNMTGLTRYSNLAETTKVAATAYSLRRADQMTGITDKNSGGTTLVSYGYTYDAAGRVTQEARTWASGSSTDTLTYTYTNNNQLTGVSHTNVLVHERELQLRRQRQRDRHGLHDDHGQRADGLAGLHAIPTTRRQHDSRRRRLDRRRVDVFVRLPKPDDGRGGEDLGRDDARIVTFTYDALDNRIGMDENGTQTWTLYDGGIRSWTSTARAL